MKMLWLAIVVGAVPGLAQAGPPPAAAPPAPEPTPTQASPAPALPAQERDQERDKELLNLKRREAALAARLREAASGRSPFVSKEEAAALRSELEVVRKALDLRATQRSQLSSTVPVVGAQATFYADGRYSGPNPVLDVDLDNATPREAVQHLCDRAGLPCHVEADFPDEPRITVRARNVKFSTALKLVTEGSGLEAAWTPNDGIHVRKAGVNSLQRLPLVGEFFRLGMAPPATPGVEKPAAPPVEAPPALHIQPSPLLETDPKTGKTRAVDPATGKILYEIDGGILTLPTTLQYISTEERSTFNCPHCKGQVTVLRQRQQPKCSRCGRAFQNDWQFCPTDGARRPALSGDWKFCPLCGKRVEAEREKPGPGELPAATPPLPGAR